LKNKEFNKLISVFRFWISYYIKYRTNKVAYLRGLGMRIGKNCDILTKVENFGSEPYLIRLGDNVTITSGVIFITHDGATRVMRNVDERWTKETGLYGKIDLGDNVFVGMNSILLPGISIGANSVVGAGSVVTRDIAADTVVAGNPAKVVCSLAEYTDKVFNKTVLLKSADRDSKRANLEEIFWKES
jgi:acetyltransferase-like isoleucine patch superfamily enzyme